MTKFLLIALVFFCVIAPSVALPTLATLVSVWLLYQTYLFFYFRSSSFTQLKDDLSAHVDDCNELNEHIEDLKTAYEGVHSQNLGQSTLSDTSVFNFKRPEWTKTVRSHMVCNCSATVAKGAHNQPFKYLCKYFNIPATEESLEKVERALNSFSAAEEGKRLLLSERAELLASVQQSIPFLIRWLSNERLMKELGFQPVELGDIHFPEYSFQYVSPAGNSSFSCDVKLDLANLEQFADHLHKLVKFRKSIAGQRALMTARLREKIKNRDGHTCQQCGLSTADERNLLLEIDHIVPLARGGVTVEENLQTLCWRCNRSKGTKLFPR